MGPAIPIAIAAAASAMSAMSGSKATKSAAAKQRHMARQAAKQVKPKKVMQTAKTVRKQYGQELAAFLGPQYETAVMTQLSKRGLIGTGIGTTLMSAAKALPYVQAFRESMGLAQQMRGTQASIMAGVAPLMQYPVTQSPAVAGLNSGLAAGTTYAMLNQQPQSSLYPRTNTLFDPNNPQAGGMV